MLKKGKLKLDPADRMDQRVLILFTPTDLERINHFCYAKNSAVSRGEVLRKIIMLVVGKWEKRNRKAS